MKSTIKAGDKIYYLTRNAFVGPGERVLELDIVGHGSNLIAVSNHANNAKRFAVTPAVIQKNNASTHPTMFDTRAEAQACYEAEINQHAQAILDKSKEELLVELYREWLGDVFAPQPVRHAMAAKIKTEFGVDVLQDS